jgi:hypothetical protein
MQAADVEFSEPPMAGDIAVAAAAAADPYYLQNFRTVLQTVLQLHGNLLTADERAYICKLGQISRPAQALYVRLINRKGPCFRIARLAYPEIGALDAPIAELVSQSLLEFCAMPGNPAARQGVLACFTLPELRAALPARAAPKTSPRTALLDWLSNWADFNIWVQSLCEQNPMIALPESNPWRFLSFLFFGELRPNLSDFVTRALGYVVTESFEGDKLHPRFASRAQATDAYRMACLYHRFREIRESYSAAELLEWWQTQGIDRRHLAEGHGWFDRLVDRLGRRLEREALGDAALELYATCPVAPARERRARLLIKSGYKAQAAALLQEMTELPCHPEEAYAARQLLARLEKNTRRNEATELQLASRTITLHYVPRAGIGAAECVETAVLAHYCAQGWQGVHSENWLWNASFGLLLWDIIYDPAHSTFHSPLQFAPSDLYTPAFYGRRRQAIETRLDALRQPAQAHRIIADHFAAKQGLANPFTGWHEDVLEILGIMLHRVPPQGHAAVLRRMAQNLRHYAHGFVDLFIWNDADYRFIEIKGENDQLAAHQFEWLRFFAKAGINVSLEKVQRPRQQPLF